jgi:hypothetical protein
MKKLIMIVALGASVLATPAFAQSFNPAIGTGNVLPFNYGPAVSANSSTVVSHQSGRPLFDMVQPDAQATSSNVPAATGGGSTGYNQMLLID